MHFLIVKNIVLIDPYCDIQTLVILSYKKKDIDLKVITSSKNRITDKLLNQYIEKYGNIKIYINDNFHDRFLVLDKTMYFNLGTSINSAGKKISIVKKETGTKMMKFIDEEIDEIISSATNI